MWPAKSVYAARIEIKFLKSIKIYGKNWDFYARNGQKLDLKATEEKASYLTRYVAFRAFLYKLWPAEHFFMLMRPLSGFEFETPVLNTG